MLVPLNFPKTELKLSKQGETIYVWDEFRKKKLMLTPEEWVRQHVLHFLVNHKDVPFSLISAEHAISVNNLSRRCDGVVFDKQGNPVAIIECKRPDVRLTEEVLHQIAQYNFKLRVNWLILTNGLQTIIANVDQQTGSVFYQDEIPSYGMMCATSEK
ncbi:MAG: type I restriction enzyme HsdR N-terminal domain-containing protein [Brumimicrobium sp.]|nr:type I restriction enzyme HsdR N-terminal domain-containing protein [Brumimicrobium sp.]MCO5269080.1 type I restriction enzyme HsdR N-terminal domain-containing protein [Brumimicrobium sp.]